MLAAFRVGAFGNVADGPRTEPQVQANSTILACAEESGQTVAAPGWPRVTFRPPCAKILPAWRQLNDPSYSTWSVCILTFSPAFAAIRRELPVPPRTRAFLQVLDTWSTLNPADMAQYYAQGDLFFDIAPVKYNSWPEFQKGVTELLKGYKSLKLTLSDDAQLHREGDFFWAVGTIKEDAVPRPVSMSWPPCAGPSFFRKWTASGSSCTSIRRSRCSKSRRG